MRLLVVPVVLACVGLGFACGEQAADRPAPAKTAEADCRKASKALLSAIETGMQSRAELRNGYVDRSADFAELYMVAAEIRGRAGDDDTGDWASNSPTGTSAIYAVDRVAKRSSDWPVAEKVHAGVDDSADGVQRVRDCVERAPSP